MASRSDIEAGKAHVLLYVKNTMTKGLRDASASLQGFGKQVIGIGAGITTLGASITGPLMGAVAHFQTVGDALDKMSARTGVSVESLAELQFAAEQSGASLGDIEKAIKKQQQLGIRQSFDDVAASIAAIEDPAERTRKAIAVWGEEGTKLLPMVNSLAALREEARQLGLTPSEGATKVAADLTDALNRVRRVGLATAFEIGAAIAPMFMDVLATVKNIAVTINHWVRDNAGIVRTVFMIGAGLTVAGAAVTAIGIGIFTIGTALGGIATAIGVVSSILAAIVSPVGLIVIGITAATVAFFKFTEAGQQAASSIAAFFSPLFELLKTGFGGIVDALMAGDIALAAQVAAKTLQAIFQNAIANIANSIGGTLGDTLGSIGTDLINGDFAGAWETATAGIAAVWDSLMAGIFGAMASMVKRIRALWDGMIVGIRGTVQAIANFAGNLPIGGDAARSLLSGLDAGIGGIGVVGSSLGGRVSSAADAVAGFQRSQADESEKRFRNRIVGGGDKAADEAAELAKELAELRKRAAEAREAAFAGPSLPDSGDVSAMAKQTFATFSAAAAVLQSGAQSATERTARATEAIAKSQPELVAGLAKMTAMLAVP